MKKPSGVKKIRGKKNKERSRRLAEWLQYRKPAYEKAITDITSDGFTLNMPPGFYVPEGKYYVSRHKFAFLRDASDEDLTKVFIMRCDDEYHGDMIDWVMLGEMLGFKQLVDVSETTNDKQKTFLDN